MASSRPILRLGLGAFMWGACEKVLVRYLMLLHNFYGTRRTGVLQASIMDLCTGI